MTRTSQTRRLVAPLFLSMTFVLGAGGLAAADEKPATSLYERLGGVGPISVVVDEFIDRLTTDDLLNANPAIKAARARVPNPYL